MTPRLELVGAVAALTLAAHAAVQGQSAQPTDAESVVTAMVKVGAAWSPSFSPRGDRIAFVTRLTLASNRRGRAPQFQEWLFAQRRGKWRKPHFTVRSR